MSGFAMPARAAACANVRGQELHGTRAPAKFRGAVCVKAAVVGLDVPDSREHLPLQPEPLPCLLVEDEVAAGYH